MGFDLSIIVPCYNEEKNISFILSDFNNLLSIKPNIELVIVDNGSTDNTEKVLKEEILKNDYKNIKQVKIEKNRGYGFAIISGLKAASADIMGWTHGDRQTELIDVLKAYELYIENNKIYPKLLIKGSRVNRKLSEKIISTSLEIAAILSFREHITDINGPPKLMNRSFLNLIENPPHDFSIDLYVIYLTKKHDYKIISFPVLFKERVFGEPKGSGGSNLNLSNLLRKCKISLMALYYLIKLCYNLVK